MDLSEQRVNLRGVNLYLIGMMGAGKTTIGHLLATDLNYHFFDTDALVEQLTGQSVAQLFATLGEPAFRQLESQVLAELAAYKNLVIATGGGVVLTPMNWSYLRHGVVAWLDVPVEQLYRRLKMDSTRPLLKEEPLAKLERLAAQRQQLYAQADVQVRVTDTDTPQQVAQRLLQSVAQVLKPQENQFLE